MCNCRKFSSKTTPVKRGCEERYQEIHDYSLRVLTLLQVKENDILNELNTKLREWLRDLRYVCPDEVEIQTIKEYLDKEENEFTENNKCSEEPFKYYFRRRF